jgi:hypothetical protein
MSWSGMTIRRNVIPLQANHQPGYALRQLPAAAGAGRAVRVRIIQPNCDVVESVRSD